MSKIKLDKDKVLKKLKTLSMTALCIQKTSKYLYQFFKSSDIIVSLWHQTLCTASEQLKVSLFYIANEMLQSRNYGCNNFKQSWKLQLIPSLDLIKNSSTIDKVNRIFNIWMERRVYEQSFVEELINRLSSARSPILNEDDKRSIILNFEPEDAMEKLRSLIKIESDLSETMSHFDLNSLNFEEKSCLESIKKLKDKYHCNQYSARLDDSINQLFQLVSLIDQELKARQSSLKLMEHAELYYQTQLNETLIVEDAYKRYGNLISRTKDALEEHLDFLSDDIMCPVDIDDAPSPGKTPPHLYGDTTAAFDSHISPMSFQDVLSPSQSMDMSDEDTDAIIDPSPSNNTTNNSASNRPYSPSTAIDYPSNNKITNPSEESNKTQPKPLSCSDALKILTSVFNQSLTKKIQSTNTTNVSSTITTTTVTPSLSLPLSSSASSSSLITTSAVTESNIRMNLQPDMFRNTLACAGNLGTDNNASGVVTDSAGIDKSVGSSGGDKNNNNNNNSSSNNESLVFADAFRLISNLTGIKNISERNNSNEPEKMKPNLFPYNQSTFPTVNASTKCDTVPHPIFPDVQSPFPTMFGQHPMNSNPLFPILSNHSGIPTQPPPPIFNPLPNNHLAFNLSVLNKDNSQSAKKSPGSCTEDEDEGGATPTQDEPVIHPNPTNIFNPNVLPVLHPSVEEINKQIQNAMQNVSANPFGMPNLLSGSNDTSSNNPIQQSQWNLANQYSFNIKNTSVPPPMNIPFNLINPAAPIQPNFSPGNNSKSNLNFGPPRAIRTKRPNMDTGINPSSNNEFDNLSGTVDYGLTPPPPPPPKSDEDILNALQNDEQKQNQQERDSKINEKESDILNLYGDVEEELDRNCNFNQQNINVRNSRPPPHSDRYHLYNQSAPPNMSYRFTDSHNTSISGNRMSYQHSHYNNYRNQFSRGGMYFPNRTTNFRPRHNYNMFN